MTGAKIIEWVSELFEKAIYRGGETDAAKTDLYAFGGKVADGYPRLARPRDFGLPSDAEGNPIGDARVGPYDPAGPPVQGASTYTDPRYAQARGLTGRVWKLRADAPMPEGLGVHADGADIPGGDAPLGHRTVYPTEEMPFSQFNENYSQLDWENAGAINSKTHVYTDVNGNVHPPPAVKGDKLVWPDGFAMPVPHDIPPHPWWRQEG